MSRSLQTGAQGIPTPTLSSTKEILIPIFDRIYNSSLHDDITGDTTKLDPVAYLQAYSACFNYIVASKKQKQKAREHLDGRPLGGDMKPIDSRLAPSRAEETIKYNTNNTADGEIYHFLDVYFKDKATEIASTCTPGESMERLKYIVKRFETYQGSTRIISRIAQFIDRYYVWEGMQEGAGWLRMSDLKPELMNDNEYFSVSSKAYRQKKAEELEKWGYNAELQDSGISMEDALGSCQAASSLNRIVPVHQLALRRFRTEIVEPLILNSDIMAEWIKVSGILTGEGLDEDVKTLGENFKQMLRRVGVMEKRIIM